VCRFYSQTNPSLRANEDKHFKTEKEIEMKTQYQRYEAEADQLSQVKPTPQSRARLQFLLSSMATLREFGMQNSDSPRTASNGAADFRKKFLSQEARVYTPLNETNNGQIIPSDFEVRLKNLMLADGPLFAGSTLLTSIYAKTMTPTKVAVSDDLAQPGIIAGENVALTNDAELTGLSGITVGNASSRFSTGMLLASVSLAEDVAPESFEQIVMKAASSRLSRIQNATFLASLKTALALNSSAAVAAGGASITAANVYSLVSAVGAAYRTSPSAAFIVSSAKQTAIGALVTAGGGEREFPEILSANPTLLGYPVFVVAAAAAADILFGDFSYLYCKSTPVELRVLRERFRADGFYGYLLSERAEGKWSVSATSNSPVKYLTFP